MNNKQLSLSVGDYVKLITPNSAGPVYGILKKEDNEKYSVSGILFHPNNAIVERLTVLKDENGNVIKGRIGYFETRRGKPLISFRGDGRIIGEKSLKKYEIIQSQ